MHPTDEHKSTQVWTVTVNGCSFTTSYDKVGDQGKENTKNWDDEKKLLKKVRRMTQGA